MNNTQNLLVVDDDAGIRNLLGEFLKQHGFQAFLATDGKAMRTILNRQSVDLVILDIMLPGEDGLSLCRQLRSESNVPIIMLTATGEEVDRIVGLEMGADDYVKKPFHPRELLARIKAVLRRAKNAMPQKANNENYIYRFADWTLNRGLRQLISPEKCEVILSAGEFALLIAFLERPQQILSRDQLLDLTKNRMADPFDRSIDIQISRLRRKLEENIKNPLIIKTVRSGGYVLSVPVTITDK